jgi:hypothetical protein
MGTHRSYIWCHQEPTRSAGTRQGIQDATSQRMCCGKRSALWTSYVILKRVPAHERKSISRNLFTLGPMLIGTFLLNWGWEIHRNSFWRRFWDTLYSLSYWQGRYVKRKEDACGIIILRYIIVATVDTLLLHSWTSWFAATLVSGCEKVLCGT